VCVRACGIFWVYDFLLRFSAEGPATGNLSSLNPITWTLTSLSVYDITV